MDPSDTRDAFVILIQHWLLAYFRPGDAAGQSMRYLAIAMEIPRSELEGDSAYNHARDFTRMIVYRGADYAHWIPDKVVEAIKNVDNITR